MNSDAEQAKRKLMAKKKRPAKPRTDDFLSSGSTLLNLAITGHPHKAFRKGHFYFLVGDSSSGKTFLARTLMAEAAINLAFDEYQLIDDDVERGALMDFERYFGSKMAARVRPPRGTKAAPIYSETIDDFYFHVDDALAKGPCIYLLDSMDALTSKYEQKKFAERKSAARKGTKEKGDYGDGKAKVNSSSIRALMGRLATSGSILIVINQTRDNIGASMFEPKQTRSGGRSLTFYSTAELWSSVGAKIKREARGKDRVVGVNARIRVKKNRITGRDRTVEVPIYYSAGIADVDSCIDFLVSEGHWRGNRERTKVEAAEYEFKGPKEKLVRKIEDEGLEDDLRALVKEVWDEVETACHVQRKSRYE